MFQVPKPTKQDVLLFIEHVVVVFVTSFIGALMFVPVNKVTLVAAAAAGCGAVYRLVRGN